VDTRDKIITAEAACEMARGGEAILVTGYFDVLLAAHLGDLQRVREARPQGVLITAVAAPPEPVLDARARAEMVAALAVVDYVVSWEGEPAESLLAAFSPDRIVRLEAVHQQRMGELIQHVHRRQSA
jgi:bifunctional ADP-heptose synthase (sugar kinase/adenylyltransferase)